MTTELKDTPPNEMLSIAIAVKRSRHVRANLKITMTIVATISAQYEVNVYHLPTANTAAAAVQRELIGTIYRQIL